MKIQRKLRNMTSALIAIVLLHASWLAADYGTPSECQEVAQNMNIGDTSNCPTNCSYQVASHNIYCNPATSNTKCKVAGQAEVTVYEMTDGVCITIVLPGGQQVTRCILGNQQSLGTSPSNILESEECPPVQYAAVPRTGNGGRRSL